MKDKMPNNLKLLVSSDNSAIKIYLDGFGILDFLRIARFVKAHGGKVSRPADDTLVLAKPKQPPGTEFLRFNISWLFDSIRHKKRQDIGKYLLPTANSDNQEEEMPNDSQTKEADADDSEVQEEESHKGDEVDELFLGFPDANDDDDDELTDDENSENADISGDSTSNSDFNEPEQVRNVEEPEAEKEDILVEINGNVTNMAKIPEDISHAPIIIFKDQESVIEVEIPKENESEAPNDLDNSQSSSRIEVHEDSTNYQMIPIIILPEHSGGDAKDVTPGNTHEDVNDNAIQYEEEVQTEGENQSGFDEKDDDLDNSDSYENGCWRFAGDGAVDGEASSENSEDHSLTEANMSEASTSAGDIEGKKIVVKMKIAPKRTHSMTVSSERSRKYLKTDTLPKMKYSADDDRKIIQYLINKDAISRADGISIWDEMVSDKILPDRSATSLKFRFTTSLKHTFKEYTDDPVALKKFEQLLANTQQ